MFTEKKNISIFVYFDVFVCYKSIFDKTNYPPLICFAAEKANQSAKI